MKRRLLLRMILLAGGLVGGTIAWRTFTTDPTIHQLLAENRQLKQGIANLQQESQIGYAKVLSQERTADGLVTRILFVETDPCDCKPLLQKEFDLAGDVVHFDALIVRFAGHMVADGKERAMYLWRRVYSESMRPEEGHPIEPAGHEPARYRQVCQRLGLRDRRLFWQEIWSLSNDPDRLKQLGVQAVYGNVVYRQLRPGFIYVFKVSSTGSLYPEVVPDL